MKGTLLFREPTFRRRLPFKVGARWRAVAQKQALLLCLALPVASGTAAEAWVEAPKDEDFTGMDLDQLMRVKVPIVYGASKHEQKITEAPSAVSIVTKDDIKQFGYRTLAEVVHGVRGWYITSDRSYDYAGVRGVNRLGDFGGRVLLMVDGHRINDPVYDAALLSQDFPLDVDLIERVEVIRGPGSALYGNNAFFGIVNVITRKGRDLDGVEASISGGDFSTYSGRASFGRQFANGLELLFSGTYYDSKGQQELPFEDLEGKPLPSNRHLAYKRASNFYGSLSYCDFTLSGLYGQREEAIAPGTYGTIFDDPRTQITDIRSFAELKYQKSFAEDWAVLARTYYDYYAFRGILAYDYMDPANPGITINRDDPEARYWGGDVQLSKVVLDRHRLTFGFEGRHDAEVRQHNFDENPPLTYINKSTPAGNLGIYGQAEVAILTNLTLSAGGRYDYFTTFGSTVNPRGGLIYHPGSLTTLKALYGEAYRAPNAYEFDFDSPNYRANHDLKPEGVRSYELVWEQGIGRRLRMTGSLFYEQIEDLITQAVDPLDGRSIFRNTDSVDVRGGEIELEGHWDYGFRSRLSYTFAEAKDVSTDAALHNSPKHLAKLQLVAPVYPDKAFLGFELLARSGVLTARGNEVGSRIIGNLTLFSHNILKGLELSASIYNLWDSKYVDPVSSDFSIDTAPQDKRSFRVKATYRF
ncbi:MAG: TonB-dependent receptor [Verrucomicrobiales bacterium]|nr:TonB-dependent receptor [Verrucomicrobiales bacterium]